MPPIALRPAAGEIVHHDGLVHIGSLTITASGVLARPCRGITNRQRLQLISAYERHKDQDVWTDEPDGPTTYISVPAVPALCAVEIPSGTPGRRSWRGSRHLVRRYGNRMHPCRWAVNCD